MSGMSDRDQKLVLILLTAMIICLPYFFFIKDKRVETQGVKTEIASLTERYNYLQSLKDQESVIVADTEKYRADADKIIKNFPADIKAENFTMFLLNAEYSTAVLNRAGLFVQWDCPMVFDSVTYGENVETPISSEEADTGLVGLTNTSGLTYECANYKAFKYLLNYFLQASKDGEPMAYRGFTAEFDKDKGIIHGTIILDQYAISGKDRTLPAVVIDPDLDKQHMRGLKEAFGIFGAKELSPLEIELLKALQKEAANQ